MPKQAIEVWDLWYPKAGATGMSFARGRVQHVDIMLVHAAPQVLAVTIRADDGKVLAEGKDLQRTEDSPIARLTRIDDRIERADIWPSEADLGRLVLLAGGEAGILKQWWHTADRSEWRWQIELYNHR